jgi:hypothetical protein
MTDKDADAKEARQIAEVLAGLYSEPVTIEYFSDLYWTAIYPQEPLRRLFALNPISGLPTKFRFHTNRKLVFGMISYGPKSDERFIHIMATEPYKPTYNYALFFEPLEELPGDQTPTVFDHRL